MVKKYLCEMHIVFILNEEKILFKDDSLKNSSTPLRIALKSDIEIKAKTKKYK